MSGRYGANAYKKTSVTTASREQILLLLYEAAIKYTKLGMKAMDEGKIAKKGESILKVHDIILELQSTLNFEVGGDIALNLERLYTFMTERLVKANMDNDRKSLEDVLGVLTNLHEGWKGAVQNLNREKAEKEKKG